MAFSKNFRRHHCRMCQHPFEPEPPFGRKNPKKFLFRLRAAWRVFFFLLHTCNTKAQKIDLPRPERSTGGHLKTSRLPTLRLSTTPNNIIAYMQQINTGFEKF